MWRLAVDESCGRGGGRTCRTGQRTSPLGPPSCSLSPPTTPRSWWCLKAMDLDALGNKDEHWGATICQVVMLFLGLTIFVSTVIVLRSVRNDQAVCIVPRVSIWGPSRLQQSLASHAQSEAATEEEKEEKEEKEAEFIANDKAWLLKQAAENGTTLCGNMRTAQALVFGFELPSRGGNIRLKTNARHQILVVSYTKDGIRRCSGGDFYETDLSGNHHHRSPSTPCS